MIATQEKAIMKVVNSFANDATGTQPLPRLWWTLCDLLAAGEKPGWEMQMCRHAAVSCELPKDLARL